MGRVKLIILGVAWSLGVAWPVAITALAVANGPAASDDRCDGARVLGGDAVHQAWVGG